MRRLKRGQSCYWTIQRPGRGRDLKAGIVGYKLNNATIMSVLHIDGVGLGGFRKPIILYIQTPKLVSLMQLFIEKAHEIKILLVYCISIDIVLI